LQAQQQLQQAGLPAELAARLDTRPGYWVLEASAARPEVVTLLARWLQPLLRVRLQPA